MTQAPTLLEGVPFEVVIADKGYDKTARNFLAFVHVASITVLLR